MTVAEFVPGYTAVQDGHPDGAAFGPMFDGMAAQGMATHWTTLTENTGAGVDDHGRAFDLDGYTLTLDPAGTLTKGWRCIVYGPGTINPDDGSDVVLLAGDWAHVGTDGTTTFIMASLAPSPSYAVAGLPDAAAHEGRMIYVPDESGGATIAFSDGTNWRRVTDRAVVS